MYSLTDAASIAAFEAELQEKVDLLDSSLTANDYQTTWRLAFGHHPIRSNSHHKDTVELLNQVSFYADTINSFEKLWFIVHSSLETEDT